MFETHSARNQNSLFSFETAHFQKVLRAIENLTQGAVCYYQNLWSVGYLTVDLLTSSFSIPFILVYTFGWSDCWQMTLLPTLSGVCHKCWIPPNWAGSLHLRQKNTKQSQGAKRQTHNSCSTAQARPGKRVVSTHVTHRGKGIEGTKIRRARRTD